MLRADIDDLDANGQKGDWCFINNDTLIAVRYGERAFQGTAILPISEGDMPGKPHWEWNGSHDAPTLTPSILVHGNPGWNDTWHGFLTDGILREA